MLWRTSPAATELEEVSLAWLRGCLACRIRSKASSTTRLRFPRSMRSPRHAKPLFPACAITDLLTPRMAIGSACTARSTHIHRSIKPRSCSDSDITPCVTFPADASFQMRADALRDAIAEDQAAGIRTLAVVATIGTTSTTSVDPVAEIAQICRSYRIWLHVDAAYAGVAAAATTIAVCGLGRFDCRESAQVALHAIRSQRLYCRRMDMVRQAFALTPDYLQTAEALAVSVT